MEPITSSTEKLMQLLPFIIPIVFLQLVLMVVALVDLSKRERVRWLPKWGWALIIILGELLGPIAYFILGREE